MRSYLEVKDLCFQYPSSCSLGPYSFALNQGDLMMVTGESGVGKTTLLRLLCGLLKPSQGSIYLDQACLVDQNVHVSTPDRKIGMLFQDYALFPHLTVGDNIAFALKVSHQKVNFKDIEERLDSMKLQGLLSRYPAELSGGQQQRVALLRALASKPKLLLMDEPFASLDKDLRKDIIQETLSVLRDLGVSGLIVTHNPTDLEYLVDHNIHIAYEGCCKLDIVS